MDINKFIKQSFELDSQGKFKEADNLTNSFVKSAQYKPQNEEIEAAGLRGGAGIGGWFADQARGMQIWMGGGVQRSKYIKGAAAELKAFYQGFNASWPKSSVEPYPDLKPNLKTEFKRYMEAAFKELSRIGEPRSVYPAAVDKDESVYSHILNNSTDDSFIELQSWVEGQMRIFSKDKAFGNYLRYLRYAETTIAALLSEAVRSPETANPKLVDEFRVKKTTEQKSSKPTSLTTDTSGQTGDRPAGRTTPRRAEPRPKTPTIKWLD